MRSTLTRALVAIALFVGNLPAQTGPYLTTNRFGYTGTIRRYTTLLDAQSAINAVAGSPFAVPQRDLGLFMSNNNTGFAGLTQPSAFDFLTAWYIPGSPYNVNTGFVQISDENGASVTPGSVNSYWDPTLTIFTYGAKGTKTTINCDYPIFPDDDCSRLWNAGSAVGTPETTTGVYYSYDFFVQASGLTSATFNPVTGVLESASQPTGVSGYFTGLFENMSLDDVTSNGFYRVDLTLNMISDAFTRGALVGPYAVSRFGTNVVPEPSTYALMLVGLGGVLVMARRRRRSVA